MKKLLLSSLSVAALSIGSLQAQVAQMPFIEHFTQASCGPCASQNPTMKTTLDNYGTAGTDYVKISHQVSFPGVDPMNASFPAGPSDRRAHYGITGVPATSLNGTADDFPNTEVTTATLTAATALTTPYSITATQTWNSATSLDLTIDVNNVTSSPISSANKIYVTMIEDEVTYQTAPGSNGETAFQFVMREMYNATTGATGATTGAAIGTIAANGTQSYTLNLTSLPSNIADLNEVSFAIYLADDAAAIGAAQTIFQAAKTTPGNVPGLLDVSTSTNSSAGAGYCDLSFTPVIDLTNNHASLAVTQAVVEYNINGGTAVQQTFNGNLTTGQSTTITFPATNLIAGSSTVNYNVVSINGGNSYSPGAVTMSPESFNKLNATGSAVPVSEGMESAPLIAGTGYSRTLNTAIFDAGTITEPLFSILDGPSYNYGAIGGFAASDRSIRFRFYNIPNGGEVKLVMQKVNLAANSQLQFAHAYRQYNAGSDDRLEVHASTDCGATWTSVFNKSGADLSTLAPSTTQYVPGASADWSTTLVDLSAFDNTNDVVLRFTGTGNDGNNLYIDDINVGSNLNASVTEASLNNSELAIMPNPVVDNMTVNFTTEMLRLELQLKMFKDKM